MENEKWKETKQQPSGWQLPGSTVQSPTIEEDNNLVQGWQLQPPTP